MTLHEHHDDHLADHLATTYDGSQTTGAAHVKADAIIAEFEAFRRTVTRVLAAAGIFIGFLAAGLIWLAVTR